MGFFNKPITKITTICLMAYTIIGGFLMPVPRIPIIKESIRNQYFHVSMWFAMMIVLTISVVYAIRYLNTSKKSDDIISKETANAGLILGILGLITGSIWANFTWASRAINSGAVSDLFSAWQRFDPLTAWHTLPPTLRQATRAARHCSD